jgi:hypothetical protein
MVIEDRRHLKRADAERHLTAVIGRELDALGARREATLQPGELAGFPLTARVERTLNGKVATLDLRPAPGTSVVIPASELADADPAALVARLENRLRRLEERKATTITDAEHARREIDHATAGLGKPFPHDADLHKARDRVRDIDAELEGMAEFARTPTEATVEEAHEQHDSTRSREPQAPRRLSRSSVDRATGGPRATGYAEREAGQ